ncbi:MAG: hypothetical protein ATN35_02885 [Epulopiscium sp. Nele67-Bin004]|nr:MAG: hypothetical protein ATN35_02885 [Epulopiscium sp. Nele67-Bin004]
MQPHIHCSSVSKHVVLVGDPARVNKFRKFMTDVKELAQNREYYSIQGIYKNTPITVMSTGMGAPSMLICIEELAQCGAENIIRVGSMGAYQKYIKLGDIVIVEGAVRDDGGSKAYIEPSYPAVSDFSLVQKAIQLSANHHLGIIRSHDSFYTDKEDEICDFWHKRGILGADMETSALLTLCRLKKIKALSILNNVVEYKSDLQDSILEFSQAESLTAEGESKCIQLSLDILSEI